MFASTTVAKLQFRLMAVAVILISCIVGISAERDRNLDAEATISRPSIATAQKRVENGHGTNSLLQGTYKTMRLPMEEDTNFREVELTQLDSTTASDGAETGSKHEASLLSIATNMLQRHQQIAEEQIGKATSLMQSMTKQTARRAESLRFGATDLFYANHESATSTGNGLFLILGVLLVLFCVVGISFVLFMHSGSRQEQRWPLQPQDLLYSFGPPTAQSQTTQGAPHFGGKRDFAEKPVMQAGAMKVPPHGNERLATFQTIQDRGFQAGAPQLLQGLVTTLCPDLIVPEASECTLLAPRLKMAEIGLAKLTVDDARHQPVFSVSFGNGGSTEQGTTRLSLHTAAGDTKFAFATKRAVGEDFALDVYDQAERLHGVLEKTSTVHQMVTFTYQSLPDVQGNRMSVRFAIHTARERTDVKSDDGKLFAMMEPGPLGPDQRSVIIGPESDAGLIVLCLLGIDWLRSAS